MVNALRQVVLGAALALALGNVVAKEGGAWREQMKANNDINSTASLQRASVRTT
jgi:hypothetical protein